MEALKMENEMGSWNDDRLDELNLRVDNGFKALDKRFDRVEQEVKEGFAKVDARFEKVDARFVGVEQRLAQMATRQEMKDGSAEIRSEMHNGFAEIRSEMNEGFAEMRSEMNQGFAEMRSAYAGLNRTLIVSAVAIVVALIGSLGALH
jgi:DNA anti-recombination protein RmuC